MKENKSTVLDILRKLLKDVTDNERWTKGWVDDRFPMTCACMNFQITMSLDQSDELFRILRKMVEDESFIHSHDILRDKYGNEFCSRSTGNTYGDPVAACYYTIIPYNPMVNMPTEKLWEDDTRLHLFYTLPFPNGRKMDIESITIYYDAHPIYIAKGREFVSITEQPYGAIEMLRYLESVYD